MQGFKDLFENPFVGFNNTQAGVSGAVGNGKINAMRALGHEASAIARMMDFLGTIRDPDMDTPSTLLVSPGTGPGATTPGQSLLNILASQVAIPLIRGGYPVGFTEATTGTNCLLVTGTTQACSQGINPLSGAPKAAQNQLSCTPGNWVKSTAIAAHANPLNATIINPSAHLQKVTSAGNSGLTTPAWNDSGGTTIDPTGTPTWPPATTWTDQSLAVPPCNGALGRVDIHFQQSSEAEGVYDARL